MQNQFEKHDYSIDLLKANLISLPISLGILIFYSFIFYFANSFKGISIFSDSEFVYYLFIPLLIVGISVHEILHGLVFVIFSKIKFIDLKFGFKLSAFTFYAHCKKPVRLGLYKLSTVTPAVLLGVIPFIISILINSFMLFVWGVFFTITAAGDFLILWLLKGVENNTFVEDHPSRLGCIVLKKRTDVK